jgi:hypothetical protein
VPSTCTTEFAACAFGNAPNKGPRSGYESLFCLGDALKKNGVSLGLDAASFGVGLLPGGTLASGFIKGVAVANVGMIGALHSAATAPSFNAGASGFTNGLVGTGLSFTSVLYKAAGQALPAAIPILGNISTGISTASDIWQTFKDQSTCVDSGKYD